MGGPEAFRELELASAGIGTRIAGLTRLKEAAKASETDIADRTKSFYQGIKDLAKRLIAGEQTLGSTLRDNVFATMADQTKGFAPGETLEAKLAHHMQKLEAGLEPFKTGEVFFDGRFHRYWAGALQAPCTQVKANGITVHCSAVATVALDDVFDRKIVWPFVTADKPTIQTHYQPYEEQIAGRLGWNSLEKELREHPLALTKIAAILGRPVSADLQLAAEAFEYKVATLAAEKVADQFAKLKAADSKIAAKDKAFAEQQARYEAAQERPVLSIKDALDRGDRPDEVFHAIATYPSREESRWAMQALETTLKDCYRTGLHKYERPVSVEHRQGMSTVYNLAQLIQGITQVLELHQEDLAKAS